MSQRSLAMLALAAIIVVATAHAFYVYPSLPDTMASHFDLSGTADGFQEKSKFMVFYALIMVMMVGTFVGIAYVIPNAPESMINIPHKDYYLAPERREATLDRLISELLWMGNATVLFIFWMMSQAFQANMTEGAPTLGLSASLSTVAYLVLILGWCVRLAFLYPKPQTA